MLPSKAVQQLESCRAAVASLEDRLSPLLAQPRRDDSSERTPLDQANWYFTLCRAVSALYVCHMRLRGLSAEEQPFAKDLERLQLYRKKIDKVESEKWLSENKRTLAVNVSAANRFISHAIPELTPQQHEALREVRRTHRHNKAGGETKGASQPNSSKQAADAFLGSLQAECPASGPEAQPACKTKKMKRKQGDGGHSKASRQRSS